MPRTELDVLEEISRKLDQLTAAVAAQGKDTNKQIKVLSGKFKPCEMAAILGTTPHIVRLRKHRGRKATEVEPR